MRNLIISGLLAASLAGCATLDTAALTTTQVYVAAQAFDAAEVTATNYLNLPPCGGAATVCRNQVAAAAIVSATRGGYKARQALVTACAASVTAAACVSDYAAVTAAVNGLQSAFTTYSIAKGS
jgi:hypothetical protein